MRSGLLTRTATGSAHWPGTTRQPARGGPVVRRRPTSGLAAGTAVPGPVRAPLTRKPQAGWEPWRDWPVITTVTHGLLLLAALTQPSGPNLLALSVPLGVILATGTLTVLHDAGHQRLSHRRGWLNAFAVQTAMPVALWVGHWTLKHRVHHRATAVYPVDDATHASSLVRLHPAVPLRPIHRYQHLYVWPLYGLAWAGELRSQLTDLWTGAVDGTRTPAGDDEPCPSGQKRRSARRC